MQKQYCGFVGIIGKPNVGKSTLMNQLIGQALSIASHKPQTTRNQILGVKTQGMHQVIFIDTPGIHESSVLLNQRINEYALQTLKDSDLNLWIIEPISQGQTIKEPDLKILKRIQNQTEKILLVINKIDAVRPEEVFYTINLFTQQATFLEVVPVSALKAHNLDKLMQLILQNLPEGPFHFEEGQITNVSETFLISEFIREAAFKQLQEELPYCTAVEVGYIKEEEKRIYIDAMIYVERDSQKGIVIGHQGQQLKSIGTQARKRIESLLGSKVFLYLQVRVLKKWSKNPRTLSRFGYE